MTSDVGHLQTLTAFPALVRSCPESGHWSWFLEGQLRARLCENAKMLNRNRRSYSSKIALVAQRASGFYLEIELRKIILRRASIFEFLHSLGHKATFPGWGRVSALPLESGHPWF